MKRVSQLLRSKSCGGGGGGGSCYSLITPPPLSSSSVLLPPPPPPALLISRRGFSACKLFVGGISDFATEKSLSAAFSQYGQVVEAKIVMDRVSDRPKGFGFVTFASEEEAKTALSDMNGKTLSGRVIFVDYAKPALK